MEQQMGLTIDGAEVLTAGRMDVIDPATEQVIGSAPEADREHVERAVTAAAKAFPDWAAASAERTEPLREAAQRIRLAADELGRLTTLEQGKPLAAAVGEAMATAQFF